MSNDLPVVIIGGGHAAAQLCVALAEAGWGARTHLVCAEDRLPYQRPPLSKGYLKQADEAVQLHRNAAWYEEQGVTVHLSDAAVALDRVQRTVRLASGRSLVYGQLVLATGTRARRLAGWPVNAANVLTLRTAADAHTLRQSLPAVQHLTVLGGGFIGLEVAATACALGKTVTVLEAAPRLLARSVSPELAEHVLATHRAAGLDIRLGVSVSEPEFIADRLGALTVNGRRERVQCLLLGVGAQAEDQLARDAGLACDEHGGVIVDKHLRTSDSQILAIGDCASFPAHPLAASVGGRLRLESVQNTNDHARTAAATLLGRDESYQALPWFWSEQGSLRLQMAGLMPADGQRCRRQGAHAQSFSILHYANQQLICVESVNAPLDHMMARKLLEGGKNPPPEAACDPGEPLKRFL